MSFSDQQSTSNDQGTQFSGSREEDDSPLDASTTESTSGGNTQSKEAQSSMIPVASSSQRPLSVDLMIRNLQMFYSILQMQSKYVAASVSPELLQLCDNIQINVPNYSQNNLLLDMQLNNLPIVLGNRCIPSNQTKQELTTPFGEQKDFAKESDIQFYQWLVAQYLQKVQATSLPHILQDLIKRQAEQVKKEEEEKIEQIPNNILNIPNIFRNIPLQNNSSFSSSDPLLGTSPDMSLHVDTDQQENERNFQPVLKVEHQVQTNSPRFEKKSRFRAKIGEIKITVSNDGSVLYCCPECNIGLPDKADVEQHVQAHLQERKYQCRECGAMLKRKEHLDQHMRGHSDDRPFKCTICHKGFKRNEHLTRHYVIHSGDKNFLCTMCQKAFSRKDHLNKHMQTHLGIRKGKMKEDSYYIDQKDKLSDKTDVAIIPKQEVSLSRKDDLPNQDINFLQQIHNFQKNQQLLQTLNTLKEQAMKETNQEEESVSISEILEENLR